MAVAAGTGVSVEMGVPVGWSAARAVSKACVYTAFRSGLGVNVEGAHAVTVKMNRIRVDRSEKSKEIRVDFDLFMIPMIAEKARHRMAGLLTFYQLLITRHSHP